MFCMKCGTKLPDDAVFCYKCGFNMSAMQSQEPAAQTPQPVAEKPKKSTGSGIKLGFRQCVTCGSNQIKMIRPGEYLCEHCGNQYVAKDQEADLMVTDKEMYDLYVKADVLRKKGEFSEELSLLLEYKDKAWNNVDFVLKLGRAYRSVGYSSKAMECYDRAIELKPDDALIYVNMGAVYLAGKEFEKAIPLYEKGVKMIAENPALYTKDDRNIARAHYGAVLAGVGRKREGEAMIRKAEADGYKSGQALREMAGL